MDLDHFFPRNHDAHSKSQNLLNTPWFYRNYLSTVEQLELRFATFSQPHHRAVKVLWYLSNVHSSNIEVHAVFVVQAMHLPRIAMFVQHKPGPLENFSFETPSSNLFSPLILKRWVLRPDAVALRHFESLLPAVRRFLHNIYRSYHPPPLSSPSSTSFHSSSSTSLHSFNLDTLAHKKKYFFWILAGWLARMAGLFSSKKRNGILALLHCSRYCCIDTAPSFPARPQPRMFSATGQS